MTRLASPAHTGTLLNIKPGTVWVRTQLEGAERYTLRVLERSGGKFPDLPAGATCAYAKLTLLDSGAVMAFFPITAMVSAQAKLLLGATWFELASPLVLPGFVFGFDMEIPAGRHPLVFILESWVVLFRPIITSGHNHPG